MKINVGEFMKSRSAKKEIHLTVDDLINFNEGSEEIKVLKPIVLKGTLVMAGSILSLNAKIHTELELTCSRCLQKFSLDFNSEMNEKFTLEPANRDDDVVFINSDSIDITELIINNIIVSLPIKRLCSKNCKGLCQICGTNLNFSTCKCEKEDLDPRLAKLKDMFSTD